MLIISRKTDESIVIDGGIRITVVGIRGDKVRLGIEAPAHIQVDRQEVREWIDLERMRDERSDPQE